jgi:hypothetical protein
VCRQLSTAGTEVLDDARQRRYCRIIFAGCCSQPPLHRPVWSMFEPAVSDHGSFSSSQLASWLSVRATSRPRIDNRIGLRIGLRPGADPTVRNTSNHHAATAARLSEVDASGDALSAPITVNISGIDVRNGQAYHGRKTTTTKGTRPALAHWRAREGHREKWQRHRRLASRVRPCSGAPGRACVLRAGVEAAIANDSVRCLK